MLLAEEPGSPQGPLGRWRFCREYAVPHIRLRQMAHLVKASGAQTVLGLGCHNGELGRLLPEVSYVGCDFVAPENPSFPFLRADLNREGVPADAPIVEAVVASGILEYIEDLPALLTDVRRHLRPKGVLIASYFNMNHLSRVLALLAGRSFRVHPDWRGFHSPAFGNC